MDGGRMSHLDEGTLHALLDGELDLSEVSEIQMHLGTCVACGSRLQEVKQVLAEADRLVGAIEVPAGAARPRPEPPRTSSPMPTREPEPWNETPVLLVPDPVDAQARRNRWMRGIKWAAAIVVIIGAGRILSSALRPSHPLLPERDLTSASPVVPPAVVSPEESRRADTPLATTRGKASRPAPQNRVPVQRATAKTQALVQERSPDTAKDLADAVAPAAEDTVAADSELLAADEPTDTGTELAAGTVTVADSAADRKARQDSASEEPKRNDDLAVRGAAAAALAELDRERRRERANAATAALPPPARPVVEPESEPAPAPRTLEQRAQVYLRVGLDEAAKQLGGPVHVIEGMSPQFIGLTRGQLVAGADPARPVVRVVYLDSRGRMILLDQQRVRAGQRPAAAAGNLRWAVGDVMLYLRGEPSPDVLRSLQARVR
jgi:putative zinc finger protein